MEFSRRRRLVREFGRVALDENDLKRLADVFKDAAEKHEQKVDITVTSVSGDETINTSSPEFFLSENMPPRLRSVSMSMSDYPRTISLRLTLDAAVTSEGASLEADGTDITAVSGYFRELERILDERQSRFGWLAKWERLMLASLVGLFVTYFSSIWLLDNLRRFATGLKPLNLLDMSTLIELIALAWAFTAASIVFLTPRQVRLLLPRIAFIGKLSDPGASGRGKAAGGMSVVLAILFNLIAWAISLLIQWSAR